MTKHIGKNIEKIREFIGMKQETLAHELGVSQQTVSRIEQSETIDDDRLVQIAKVLNVSKEAIENYQDEKVFFYIQNMHEHASANYNHYASGQQEKVVALYERMLEDKDQVIKMQTSIIENFINKQKAS